MKRGKSRTIFMITVVGIMYSMSLGCSKNTEDSEIVRTREIVCDIPTILNAPNELFDKPQPIISEDVKQTVEQTEDIVSEQENKGIIAVENNETVINTEDIQYTFIELDGIKYVNTSLNIRDMPNADGNKIGSFSVNTQVHITGQCTETGWYRVEFNNTEAYISNNYVQDTEVEVVIQENVSGVFIGIHGASQSVVDYANRKWADIPETVRDKLVDCGYTFYITGQNLEDVWGYSYKIAAITVYQPNEVYIENSTKQVNRALTHELGHALDDISGSPSITQEFQDIFYAERDNFHDYTSIGDGNETSCLTEYFASVFDNIINNGKKTQQDVPLSYEYVSKFIN